MEAVCLWITYLPLHTRYRYGLEDSFKEEMEEGIIKGFKQKVERKGKRGIKKAEWKAHVTFEADSWKPSFMISAYRGCIPYSRAD